MSNMTFLQVERHTIEEFIAKMTMIGDVSAESIANIRQTVRKSFPVLKRVHLETDIFLVWSRNIGFDSKNPIALTSPSFR